MTRTSPDSRPSSSLAHPRVVLVHHSAQPDTATLAMAHLAVACERFQPFVLLGEDGPIADLLREADVPVELTRLRSPRDVRDLVMRLSRLAPALVHVHSIEAGLVAGTAARAARVPVVWQVHDSSRGRRGWRGAAIVARSAIRALAAVAIVDSPHARAWVPHAVPSCLIPDPASPTRAIVDRVELAYDSVVSSSGYRARHVVVNGRFRTRPMSGVERFAENVSSRVTLPTRVHAPPRFAFARGALGHLWEQVVLPLHIGRNAILWSPCNFGPAVVRRQVVTVHDLAPCDHPEWFSLPYRAWFNFLVPRLCRRSLAVTAVSSFTKDRLVDRFGLDPATIHVVPNGFELPAVTSTPTRTTIDSSAPYVLAVGSVDPRKNISAVQQAVACARQRHPLLRLVIVGHEQRGVFAHHANHANNHDTFVGHVSDEDLASLYASARCLVYPSFYEGFGLPPLEAMALGTRVVASDLPPVEEVCGTAAVLVDPTDPADIARGLELVLLESDDQRAAAVAHGKLRAAEYTWEQAAGMVDTLVAGLWSRPVRQRPRSG